MPDMNQKKAIIIEYLIKCNAFSDQMLEGYEKQVQTAGETEQAPIQVKIQNWESYREFNDYAINELKGDELDHWFADQAD